MYHVMMGEVTRYNVHVCHVMMGGVIRCVMRQ